MRILLTWAFILENQTCKTSSCIILKDCNPYMNLIASMEKPLGRSVVAFLRSQECGFQDGYPKVCCTIIPNNLKTVKQARPAHRGKFNKLNALRPSKSLLDFVSTTRRSTTVSTTKMPPTAKRVNETLREKMEALNNAFSADYFDLTGTFDLMLRKRGKRYDSFLEIEIR